MSKAPKEQRTSSKNVSVAEKVKHKVSAVPAAAEGAVVEKKIKRPEKSKVRRIHVSGLPAISEADVKDRFKSFGTVTGVDGLGKLDGNGNPLRYAFVDIDITKSKLAQCMNLLSGSVWKGSTLRIAEAKPTFMDRIARERDQAARQAEAEASIPEAGAESTSKKRKRADDTQSKEVELATGENVKNRAGWKLDPQSSTPIFPIVARPDHPLPALPSSKKAEKAKVQSAAKVDADGKKDKKALKKKKAAAAAAAAPVEPPSRAQRVKIDPTRWQPKHLRAKEFPRPSANSPAVPSLEETAEEQASSSDDSASDTSQASDESDNGEEEDDIPPIDDTAATDSDLQLVTVAAVEDSDAGAAERKAQMDLIASMLGGRLPESISAREVDKTVAGASLEGGTSSSDSSESAEGEEDNVRENANMSEAVSNENEEASEDDAAQEEEVAVEEEVAESASSSSDEDSEAAEEVAPTQPAPHTIQMQSLTEMFKPQESVAGFTLGGFLDDLDLDLEELPELGAGSGPVASETAQPLYRSAAPPARSQPSSQRAGAYDPHEPLFFPFPFDEDDKPEGILHGMPESQRMELLERSWTGKSTFKRFKRTQNIEDITAQYETARKVLTEQVRKRHREAAKRRKRTGGRGNRKVGADDDE